MTRPGGFLASIVVAASLLSSLSVAAAQQKPLKERLLGTWLLVAVDDIRPDGSKQQLFGPNPQGSLMLDATGRYSLQLCTANRPKFTSKNRLKGTVQENEAAVHGCNPHFGRYEVDEPGGTILFRIDHAMFPNWEGTEQRRAFTLAGDQLSYTVPNSTIVGAKPVVIWKRAD